jgi:hypothetical protein
VADNVVAGTGAVDVATRKVTYSGDANQNAQVVGLVAFSGSDDAKTATDIPGDGTNGLLVDVSRVQGTATVAGTVAVSTATVGGTVAVSTVTGVGTVTTLTTGTVGVTGTVTVQESSTQVDDATFAPASARVTMVGATFDDVSPDSVNEGDGGAIRMSANRNLYATLRDAAGNERGVNVTAGNALVVDGSAATQPVSGTLAVSTATVGGTVTVVQGTAASLNCTEASASGIRTAVELIDDIVYTDDTSTHATGTSKGALFMAAATPTDATVNANDIGAVAMTTDRKLHVSVQDTATVAGTLVVSNVTTATVGGSVTISSLPASTNTIEVVGDIAHDTGVSGNPVQIAGGAVDCDDTAPPLTVSAEQDTTRLATDRDGALFTRPHGPRVWSYHEDSSTALTDATVHSAPAAGLSLYVGSIVVSTGAATAMNVFFEEGSTKVLGPYYLEATAGRGFQIQFNPPKKITAATALTITTSAAIAHSIDVTGFTAQG